MSEIITFKLTKYIWTYSQTFDCLMVGNLLFCSFALRSFHCEQIALIALYKRIDLKKQAIRSKKFVFLYVFHCFSPFYAQVGILPVALPSLQKSNRERFAVFQERITLSLFFKSELRFRSFSRVNRSFALFREWIALSLFFKSESLFRSQKWAIRLKKQRANPQPWIAFTKGQPRRSNGT